MATSDYLKQLQDYEKAKPSEYSSQYQPMIDATLQKIQNRNFSYNFNADPMYQLYKDRYTAEGKQAGMNAAVNAANNTGGFANSYATTASASANNQAMQKLSSMIPQLYQAAAQRFTQEGDQLKTQYTTLTDAENQRYQQFRDQMTDYQTDRGYYYNKYSDSVKNDQWQTQFDYTKSRDSVADSQWLKEFNEQVRQFGLNYALQKARG